MGLCSFFGVVLEFGLEAFGFLNFLDLFFLSGLGVLSPASALMSRTVGLADKKGPSSEALMRSLLAPRPYKPSAPADPKLRNPYKAEPCNGDQFSILGMAAANGKLHIVNPTHPSTLKCKPSTFQCPQLVFAVHRGEDLESQNPLHLETRHLATLSPPKP